MDNAARRWPAHLAWVKFPADGPNFTLARSDEDDLTGAYTWPAGMALATELDDLISCRERLVLDLGCGQGALGLTALSLGAQRVLFSDASPVVCDFMARLLTANHLNDRAAVMAMTWGTVPAHGPYDVIVGGDILYRAENIPALAHSIKHGLTATGCCLLSDPRRSLEADLPAIFAQAGLTIAINRQATYNLIRCGHA